MDTVLSHDQDTCKTVHTCAPSNMAEYEIVNNAYLFSHNWFQGNIMCIDRRQSTQLCHYQMGITYVEWHLRLVTMVSLLAHLLSWNYKLHWNAGASTIWCHSQWPSRVVISTSHFARHNQYNYSSCKRDVYKMTSDDLRWPRCGGVESRTRSRQ